MMLIGILCGVAIVGGIFTMIAGGQNDRVWPGLFLFIFGAFVTATAVATIIVAVVSS